MEKDFYVYIDYRLTDNQPFYVGKGRKDRYKTGKKNKHWAYTVEKHGYKTMIVKENLSEKSAHKLERALIKRIGRSDKGLGPLVNHTDGGEGAAGLVHKEATKKQWSIIRKGRPNPNKGKKIKDTSKMGRPKGIKWSDTEREKQAQIRNSIEYKERNKESIEKRIARGRENLKILRQKGLKPALGKVWVNNGSEQTYVFHNQIPKGFILGRLPFNNSQNLNKSWYNNGRVNKLFSQDEDTSGWTKGKIRYMKNTIGLEILTDAGWSKFDGLIEYPKKETLEIKTENSELVCTYDHVVFDSDMNMIEAKDLKSGDNLATLTGKEIITDIRHHKEIAVYDIFNVHKNNRFYANKILIKNCSFVSNEETLINPMILARLQGVNPDFIMGTIRWYSRPLPNKTYLLALDPSMGTGRDDSAIQVYQLPEMLQIAEWRHNRTDVPGQLRILRDIIRYIQECWEESRMHREGEIFWTVENNSIGEAANIVIKEVGEENFGGTYLSQPQMGGTKRRKGYYMSAKMKFEVCSRFKSLIERNKIHVKSKALVTQLKSFVRSGSSYAAKSSEHDDLVMSTLLVVKMLERVMSFEDSIRETFQEGMGDDESNARAPLWGVVSSGNMNLYED